MSDLDLRNLAGERFERDLAASWAAKDYARALDLSRELLAVREQALGPNDPAVVNALCDVAELQRRLGQPRESERLLTRALAAEETRGASPRLGQVAFQLAQALLERGAAQDALPHLQRAAAMADVPEQVIAYGSLATVLRSLGLMPEARRAADQALVACDPRRTRPVDAAQAHNLAAELCEEVGELSDARARFISPRTISTCLAWATSIPKWPSRCSM